MLRSSTHAIRQLVGRFLHDERGASAIEYRRVPSPLRQSPLAKWRGPRERRKP